MFFSSNDRCRAYTLIELLASIAIVAALSAIVIGAGRHSIESGKSAKARAELAALSIALEDFRRLHGDFPAGASEAQLLQALLGRLGPRLEPAASRPLIDPVAFSIGDGRDPFSDTAARLVDPWGEPYRYAYRTDAGWSNASYLLYSAGPDGRAAPALRPGGYHDDAAEENRDNLVANRE